VKIPRDINAAELISVLTRLGYVIVRQTSSHVRLEIENSNGTHAITVPNHKPIKIGTLHSIVKDVCSFNGINISDFYACF